MKKKKKKAIMTATDLNNVRNENAQMAELRSNKLVELSPRKRKSAKKSKTKKIYSVQENIADSDKK